MWLSMSTVIDHDAGILTFHYWFPLDNPNEERIECMATLHELDYENIEERQGVYPHTGESAWHLTGEQVL